MSGKRRQTDPKKQSNKNNKQSKSVNQIRIIGGQFKRQFVPFIDADGLRPSPDRLRETLFNWIQFDLHDAKVLDVCAGSGVLGLEALSRGAQFVNFIELQPRQAELISQTAEKLKLSTHQYQIHVGDALKILPDLNNIQPFHIVFIDPPYDLDLWEPLLASLLENNLILAETLIYIEDRKEINSTLENLNIEYSVLKETKIGQIFASLIQLNF